MSNNINPLVGQLAIIPLAWSLVSMKIVIIIMIRKIISIKIIFILGPLAGPYHKVGPDKLH